MKGQVRGVLLDEKGDIHVTLIIKKSEKPEFIDGDFYTLKPYKERRSLDANAYYWKLASELSATLNVSPAEIYRQHIQNIGDNYEILPIKDVAVERFCEAWGHNGVGWSTNSLGRSKIDGYVNVVAYYGSSIYNSKQMAQLIDLMVTDCKEQGIETLTPKELEKLKGLEP